MPKPVLAKVQLNVRVSPDAMTRLARLQATIGDRAGIGAPVSQSQAIETLLRQADTSKGGKGR